MVTLAGQQALDDRLGFLAHELRSFLDLAAAVPASLSLVPVDRLIEEVVATAVSTTLDRGTDRSAQPASPSRVGRPGTSGEGCSCARCQAPGQSARST